MTCSRTSKKGCGFQASDCTGTDKQLITKDKTKNPGYDGRIPLGNRLRAKWKGFHRSVPGTRENTWELLLWLWND